MAWYEEKGERQNSSGSLSERKAQEASHSPLFASFQARIKQASSNAFNRPVSAIFFIHSLANKPADGGIIAGLYSSADATNETA